MAGKTKVAKATETHNHEGLEKEVALLKEAVVMLKSQLAKALAVKSNKDPRVDAIIAELAQIKAVKQSIGNDSRVNVLTTELAKFKVANDELHSQVSSLAGSLKEIKQDIKKALRR